MEGGGRLHFQLHALHINQSPTFKLNISQINIKHGSSTSLLDHDCVSVHGIVVVRVGIGVDVIVVVQIVVVVVIVIVAIRYDVACQ